MPDVQILSQTRCELGEGPYYCPRRNTLYWFDILNKRRYAHDFESGLESFINLPEMASAMASESDRHDVIFTESGLWRHEVGTGCWSPCASVEADNDTTRSNDARTHRSGAMWLGTMGKSAEKGAGALYHYRAGTLTKLFDQISIPNAICFSKDGRTAFFTDTLSAKLMRVETDPATGLPLGPPQIHCDHRDGLGGIDGAICGADGMLYNARWGASCLDVYRPDGTRQASHVLPVTQPSCPAFLGNGAIAITSACQGMDQAQRDADPHAGKTLIIEIGAQPVFEPKAVL